MVGGACVALSFLECMYAMPWHRVLIGSPGFRRTEASPPPVHDHPPAIRFLSIDGVNAVRGAHSAHSAWLGRWAQPVHALLATRGRMCPTCAIRNPSGVERPAGMDVLPAHPDVIPFPTPSSNTPFPSQAKSGHPGLPMGCAPMTYVIWKDFMNVNPKDPKWPNRDRFVLSAGHGSMLQYSILHLMGFDLPVSAAQRWLAVGRGRPGAAAPVADPMLWLSSLSRPICSWVSASHQALRQHHLSLQWIPPLHPRTPNPPADL